MPVKNFIPSLGNLPENAVITNKFSRKADDTLIGPNNKKQRSDSDDNESGNGEDDMVYEGGKSRSSKKRVSKTRKSTKRYRRVRRHRRRTSRK